MKFYDGGTFRAFDRLSTEEHNEKVDKHVGEHV